MKKNSWIRDGIILGLALLVANLVMDYIYGDFQLSQISGKVIIFLVVGLALSLVYSIVKKMRKG
ncbi:MAG: hypothetical protein AB8F95_11490 [Bacteroidia bacterium]